MYSRPVRWCSNLHEAEAKMAGLNLSATEQSLWLAILRETINAAPTESLTVDRLALLPEFSSYAKGNPRGAGQPGVLSAKISRPRQHDPGGLMKRDMRLTAFVRHKVADTRACGWTGLQLDRKLVDCWHWRSRTRKGGCRCRCAC